jgi:hypothetical protein
MTKNKIRSISKKIVGITLAVVLIFTSGSANMILADECSNEIVETNVSHIEDLDSITNDRFELMNIGELYDLRAMLMFDYDENIERINEIDERLIELGVEDIEYSEVVEMFNNASVNGGVAVPTVDLPSSNTVDYTTYREVYVYRGKQYQLQYVMATPKNNTGELIITDSIGSYTYNNCNTNSTTAISIATTSFYNNVPRQITGDIATDVTVYEILSKATSNSPGFVANLSMDFELQLSTTFKYIFVKYQGDLDTGNQILAYEGSSTVYNCNVSVTEPVLGIYNRQVSVTGTVASSHYSYAASEAAECFRQYKDEGNANYPYRYRVYHIKNTTPLGTEKYTIDPPIPGF